MLTEFDGSDEHLALYLEFRKRMGFSDYNEKFVNPFSYYEEEHEANISLWMLIIHDEVIASVITKKQRYIVSGTEEEVYFLKYPVSLSLVDTNYTFSAALLASAIKKNLKSSYLLGMGGTNSRAAKFFSSARFVNIEIPFYLKIISWRSLILHNPLMSNLISLKNRYPNEKFESESNHQLRLKQVDWISSCTQPWKDSSFSLMRTDKLINAQTPSEKLPFIKFNIMLENLSIGSLLVLESAPRNHKYFGNLNLWTVLEIEFDNTKVEDLAINDLVKNCACKRDIDIVLINSGAKRHIEFCKKSSWIQIKSNFCISFSPKLHSKVKGDDIYITRIDGDGPINLGVDL